MDVHRCDGGLFGGLFEGSGGLISHAEDALLDELRALGPHLSRFPLIREQVPGGCCKILIYQGAPRGGKMVCKRFFGFIVLVCFLMEPP